MEKIIIIEELNKMKYLLNYKKGVVISEQNHLIKELDIYDDKFGTLIDELKSDNGFTTIDGLYALNLSGILDIIYFFIYSL